MTADPYAAVIADLTEKRDALTEMIAALSNVARMLPGKAVSELAEAVKAEKVGRSVGRYKNRAAPREGRTETEVDSRSDVTPWRSIEVGRAGARGPRCGQGRHDVHRCGVGGERHSRQRVRRLEAARRAGEGREERPDLPARRQAREGGASVTPSRSTAPGPAASAAHTASMSPVPAVAVPIARWPIAG